MQWGQGPQLSMTPCHRAASFEQALDHRHGAGRTGCMQRRGRAKKSWERWSDFLGDGIARICALNPYNSLSDAMFTCVILGGIEAESATFRILTTVLATYWNIFKPHIIQKYSKITLNYNLNISELSIEILWTCSTPISHSWKSHMCFHHGLR